MQLQTVQRESNSPIKFPNSKNAQTECDKIIEQ